jgi:uncharacterized protein (TIGR00299 family) protein
MNILKIEPFSGLSGDMFLGALAELIDGWDNLLVLPQKLHLENVEIKISNVIKAGISCKHIKVVDHNHYIDHNSNKNLKQQPALKSLNINNVHFSKLHQHSHHNRHLNDINKIIDDAELPETAKQISKKIFLLLGEAEAKVHGVDINKIHFHEVGAIDSVIDIIGSSLLIDQLKISKVFSYDICTGFGFAKTEHGKLPIPCPATKELLLGFPTYPGKITGEMTTPTGAAILKYLNPDFDVPTLIEKKIGHGPGEKEFEHPNVLRLSICENFSKKKESIFVIETNIDDSSSELFGIEFQNKLFENGAIDFYFTQVQMKKGRPGLLLSAICEQKNIKIISDFILENSTSIGIRYYPVQRNILNRAVKNIETSLGNISVKEITLPSGNIRLTPEYESCLAISKIKLIPLTDVFIKINSEINIKK